MREWSEVGALVLAGIIPLLAYTGAGLALLRALDPRVRGTERLALAYAFGTGAASLALLGWRGFDLPLPLWGVAGIALAGAPFWRGVARGGEAGAERASQTLRTPSWVRAVDALALAVAALTLAAALGPETYWDGFEYHLPMVASWCEGPIRALPGSLDAEFRAGIDLLYAPAVCAGYPDAAAAVSAGFAAALAALVRAEARRRASPGAGSLAGLFVLIVPFTLDNAPSTYVDLGVGTYGFLALLYADRWNRGAQSSVLGLAALMLVAAVNAKLHAAVLVPVLVVLVLGGGRPAPAAAIARCGAIVALGVTPWLVKQAMTTGNPFFPFLGEIFGTGAASADHLLLRRQFLASDFSGPRTPLRFFDYLASMALGRNPHISGLLGPLPFALLPAALHRTTRATGVLAALLFTLVVLEFAFMPALRFGAPLWPWLAVAAAFGGARIAAAGPVFARVLGVLFALLLVHHLAATGVRYVPRIAAWRTPTAYENAIFPDQASLRRLVADGEGVVAIPDGAVAWMPRPVYLLHWQRNGELFFEPLRGRYTHPDAALRVLRRRGVGTVIVDVAPPRVGTARTGVPTVDAWLAGGQATLRRDVAPLPARGGRSYVRVDLRSASP